MAYCGRCGTQVDGRFCGSCGEPVAAPQAGAAPQAWATHQWPGSSGPHTTAGPNATSSPVSAQPGGVDAGVPPAQFVTPPPAQFVTPPPPPPPPPASPRRTAIWVTAGVVVIALVAGFWVYRSRQDPNVATPTASVSAVPTDDTSSSPTDQSTESSTPSVSPEVPTEKPATTLARLREQDLASAVLDGRWIAQLASKYDGVVDRTQTAASGGHTFRLADIVAEHQSLRNRFESQGISVLLLRATDFGRQRGGTRTIWVTIADPGAGTKDEMLRWCTRNFPNRTKKQVENVCFPREFKAPY